MPLIIKFSDFLDKPKGLALDFVECKYGSTSCTHEATHKNNHGVPMCLECLKIHAKHQRDLSMRHTMAGERQPMPQSQGPELLPPNHRWPQRPREGDQVRTGLFQQPIAIYSQQQQMAYQQQQMQMIQEQQMQMMGNMQQANNPAQFGDQSLPRNAGFFGMSWRSVVGLPPESEGSD